MLFYNTLRRIDIICRHKLDWKWLGPYRINEVIPEKGTYVFKDLNGMVIIKTVGGSQFKFFYKCVIKKVSGSSCIH